MQPVQLPQDLPYQLMDFRTSYLRAMARAAVDLQFRRHLTDEKSRPLAILEEYFGYRCPWNLTLVLKDNAKEGPRVNVGNGTVMTLPYIGESITIYIPKRPGIIERNHDPVKEMEALAAYYDLTPFLLPRRQFLSEQEPSPAYDPHVPAPEQGAKHPEPSPKHPHGPSKWFSVDMLRDSNARFDLGVTIKNFVSFAACMFNVVALTWNNEHFGDLLTSPESPESAIGLLKTWLGYEYPWWMDLRVRIDPHARFAYDKTKKKGTWYIKAPQLTLTLPWMTGADHDEKETEINRRDTHVSVMGLTLYNTDGAGYPFTCG